MLDSILGTILAIISLVGGSFAIEKSPIKINPLTILKKFLVGDLIEELGKISIKVDDNEKDRIRYTVLQYRKAARNGEKITETEMEHISNLHDKYHNKLHGNSYETKAYEEICEIYKQQTKNNI